MEIFRGYLKKNMIYMVLGLLCMGICGLVFYLYGLPVEAVGYSGILCGTLAAGFFAAGYVFYRKKHKLLIQLQQEVTVHLENLPESWDLLEEDYLELLKVLYREKNQIQEEMESGYQESVDYYTLWVHQIKTPIAGMRLLLQSEEMQAKEELEMEVFQIEQYVEMVLQYLRMSNMGADMNLRLYNLETLVRQAIRKYSRLFIMKKISLDLSQVSCRVVTDEKWVVFVLEQILSNALKYTKKGRISIYLEKEQVLVIEDTGIGIQAEDLPRVFDKGFTGYNGRRDKKSTGIGLYLCQQILKKLSHRIQITSQVGQGTKVSIDFSAKYREFE